MDMLLQKDFVHYVLWDLSLLMANHALKALRLILVNKDFTYNKQLVFNVLITCLKHVILNKYYHVNKGLIWGLINVYYVDTE